MKVPYKEYFKVLGTVVTHKGFSYSDSRASAAAMEGFMHREPKTKEQFLNKMLMSDFSGDIRDLAADRNITIKRHSANVLDLTFNSSGQHFQLVVRKPRTPEMIAAMEAKKAAKLTGANVSGKAATRGSSRSKKAPAYRDGATT